MDMRKPDNINCSKCTHCGFCCRRWDIYLSKEDIRKIAGLNYPIRHFLRLNPHPVLKMTGKKGDCVFLNKDVKCELHLKHGYKSKPFSCRVYPEQVKRPFSGKNDYLFFEYGKKTITRDLLIGMLDSLKNVGINDFFDVFSEKMKTIESQDERFLDLFNFNENKKGAIMNPFWKLNLRLWVRKIEKKDIEDLKALGGGFFDPKEFIGSLQDMIRKNKIIYPNLPEKMMRFFYLLKYLKHTPYTKDLEEYMERINRNYH
ncbi:MAG: YkgJ family cysteine cluster protein [Candidatus Aenigmarchaeota archaeon]|nr:YkgJ family cysteine cluster protein [Candidatus Aenigmarchaeota archaeon]